MTYSELKSELENAPKSWCPALLAILVEKCAKENVFVEDGLTRFVADVSRKSQEP